MNKDEIIAIIRESDSSKIKLAVVDIDGVLRGKILHKDKFLRGVKDGLGFCNVIFGWDSNDNAYDNSLVTGWHTGYSDASFTIDLNTYRRIPWENNVPFFLGDFSESEDAFKKVCPRSLLKRIQQECLDNGYHPLFTQEFEWFNFKEDSKHLAEKNFQHPEPITTGMFGYSLLRPAQNSMYFNDLFDLLEDFGIPLEGFHTETGPGVYEACTHPNVVLEAADQATLFKTSVKEIAYRHGIIASFMAKWNKDLPGCSGHIHQSLWSLDKSTNLFYDANATDRLSPLMKNYIAGQLHCLPYILPLYAPTINSYKRLVEGAWAPTTVTWGMDNRTTALRALNPTEKLTRLETRIPGSDVNPYLAMAAALASGLYGIKHKMALEIPPVEGNGYEEGKYGKLATNLSEATQLMKNSKVATELFGEDFVDHFVRTREWEWRQFSTAVSDWELKRYFEII